MKKVLLAAVVLLAIIGVTKVLLAENQEAATGDAMMADKVIGQVVDVVSNEVVLDVATNFEGGVKVRSLDEPVANMVP